MRITFGSKNVRIVKLFVACKEYFREQQSQINVQPFDETYHGNALVSDLSKNCIGFHLSDGRKIRHVPISSYVSNYCCRLDFINLSLGRKQNKWYILGINSIINGSAVLNRDLFK